MKKDDEDTTHGFTKAQWRQRAIDETARANRLHSRVQEVEGRHAYRVAEYKKLEEKCKVLEHDNLRERQRVEALLYALQCMHGDARRTGLKHGVGVAAATEAGLGFVTRADGSCGWEKIAKDDLAMAVGPEGEK